MKHPVDAHVGKRIRHRRWMVGMTQQQLADKVGIKFQQIQKYETGMNRVSASRLWDIADALGVLQTQDIMRQQIEHIEDALRTLDEHVEDWDEQLTQTPDNPELLPSLGEKMDVLFNRYVMHQQRNAHLLAIGKAPGETGLPRVELF